MAGGWLTEGLSELAYFVGSERFGIDQTIPGSSANPSSAGSLIRLAAAISLFSTTSSKTTVSGTRYTSSYFVGASSPPAQDGGPALSAPVMTATGVQLLVGSTGGTDNWIVELHDSAGLLVATSALAGTTAGTAGTWQQIPFTATVQLLSGQYFLVVQSNGTTAHPACYNFPAPVAGTTQLLTAATTGVFGTSASIAVPTTYTANTGPMALLY